MTAVHLQVVFCCALALCAAYFVTNFLLERAKNKDILINTEPPPLYVYPGTSQISYTFNDNDD